jgi:DNA polymerase
LDELTDRYLRQQLEIGGREVVIAGGRVGGQPGGLPASPESIAATPAPLDPQSPSGQPPARPPARLSARPAARLPARDWRVGAPAIPGPGLTIPAPAIDLLSPAASWPSLEAVATEIAGCRACFLCQGRRNVVPGEGNPAAELVLVGEGPGQTEDETGRPFVGRAGELLTEILAAIGYTRDQVFICNVVKCRPPQNRKPLPEEIASCSRYLEAQLSLIKPKVILALGATAAEALLQTKRSLADLRGKVHSYRGSPLVVTYHPAALLRNPNWKKPTWDDVRIARQLIDR